MLNEIDQYSTFVGIMLVTLVIIFYYYCRYKLNYWGRRGVLQFKNTNLIFGNYKNGILLRTAPAYHLAELYREAPKDVRYIGFYIFHKPCIFLKDPELVKHILIRDFNIFYDRYFAGERQMDSLGLVNLFGMKNPVWKYVRNKTLPTFSRKNLKLLIPMIMETGDPMIEYLRNEPVNDRGVKVIDAQNLNYKYAADIIANVAFGVKTNSFKYPDSEYTKSFMSFFRGFRRKIALLTVFFMPKLVELVGPKILFDSTYKNYLQKVFQQSIESREKSGGKRGDCLDSIIGLKNEKQSALWKFEGENLFYQSGLFFSGFESSTTTLIYTLVELASNKKYQDSARADIKNAIAKHGWTYEAFADMKYLDLCISESVRLYPPVAHLDRYTCEDYKVPDTELVLEKGTPVFMSIYGMHTDSKNFEDPQAFIPERWIDVKKVPDAYIPFGGGPRMCIGMEIGRMHVKVVLSKILSKFEVYRNPNEGFNLDRRSSFTASANGLSVEFKSLE